MFSSNFMWLNLSRRSMRIPCTQEAIKTPEEDISILWMKSLRSVFDIPSFDIWLYLVLLMSVFACQNIAFDTVLFLGDQASFMSMFLVSYWCVGVASIRSQMGLGNLCSRILSIALTRACLHRFGTFNQSASSRRSFM